MVRGVRLLLAENTMNTNGHQAALLWEKGNHNCESLAVMLAIILIKNNLPSLSLSFSFSLCLCSLLFSSLYFYRIFLLSLTRSHTHAFIHNWSILYFTAAFLTQSVDQSIVSHLKY